MAKTPSQRIDAFTVEANGIANVLKSPIGVSEAFDPKTSKTHPKVYETEAIWDTGATNSVICKKVIDQLGLKPIGTTIVQGVNSSSTQNVYLVNILLPQKVGFPGIRVTEGDLAGAELLIGMDIIVRGDFAISNADHKTSFTFRVPSQKKTDYVKEIDDLNHTPVKVEEKVGRNEPCPCGSGKKYKQCHGKP